MKEISDLNINYPDTMETIYSTPLNDDEYPFWVSQYGITYSNKTYHQIRPYSMVTAVEYVSEGSGVINVDNKSYIVNAGDSYVLPEGKYQNYYSSPDNPMKKIWFNCKGVLSKELLKIYKLNNTTIFKNVCLLPYIQNMHKLCNTENDPKEIQRKASILFLEIMQFLSKSQVNLTADSDNIDLIRHYIDSNICGNISLSDIAEFSNYTKDHIIRIFKQKYKITPHQYILESKIQIAKAMLSSGAKSVEEISNELNFSDPHHFSALFLKNVGMRPLQYKKKMVKFNKSLGERNENI